MKKNFKFIYLMLILIFLITTISTYDYNNKKELINIINNEITEASIYTPYSYSNYKQALNEAKYIKKQFLVNKEKINIAIENIKNQTKSLQRKPNKDALIKKYNEAIKINTSLYLPKTVTKLNNTIYEANKVNKNENTLIEDVNKTIEALDNTINDLIIKPDRTLLNNTIQKAKNIKDNNYTTKTYKTLLSNISKAESLAKNENTTQEEIDDIINTINNDIKNLKKSTKGVYKIYTYTSRISNNHVGNEWFTEVTYNNKEIYSLEITAPYNSKYINLYATITEDDTIPDIGYGKINILLKDGNKKTTKINVVENRGRYYGNIAVWEFTCKVKLIEKV